MSATPARIAFVLEEWRRAEATTASVRERHGQLARESDDPIEAYFDNVADAQVIATARQDLLSPERRRFSVTAIDLEQGLGLDYLTGAIPLGRFIDSDKSADLPVLVAEIGFNFETQRAIFGIWG